MTSKMIEGFAKEITDAIIKLNGRVVRAVVFLDELPAVPPLDLLVADEWERDLDAMMAAGPVNPNPADVSREAMYRPETL